MREALAELNAGGGLLGRTVEAISVDDACRSEDANTVAQRLVRDDVAVVIGHACAGAAHAAASVYAAAGRIMITPAGRHPRLTEIRPGGTLFRLAGRDDRQGGAIGQAMAEAFKGKRIAVLHDYTRYGKGLALEVERTLRAAGLPPVLLQPFAAGEPSYAGIVKRLQAAQVVAVFLGCNLTEFALIAKELRAANVTASLFGGDVLKSEAFIKLVGPAGEGVRMAFTPDPSRAPAAATAIAKLRAKGIEPEGAVLPAYAALQVWAEAVRRAEELAPAAVAKALHTESFQSALGPLVFDAKGEANVPSHVIYKLENGAFRELDPVSAPPITGPGIRP